VSEDRPFLQIPLESEEERRMYEQWLEKQKEKKHEKQDDKERVIVIDI
jgi:hypothetical protein